jgi:hypothetical protein
LRQRDESIQNSLDAQLCIQFLKQNCKSSELPNSRQILRIRSRFWAWLRHRSPGQAKEFTRKLHPNLQPQPTVRESCHQSAKTHKREATRIPQQRLDIDSAVDEQWMAWFVILLSPLADKPTTTAPFCELSLPVEICALAISIVALLFPSKQCNSRCGRP